VGAFPQPAIPVFPAGWQPLPGDMTSWIQDSFAFLSAGKLMLRGEQHTAQALTSAAVTWLSLDHILENPYGGWSPAGTGAQPASSWLVPYTGWYEVTLTVPTANQALWCAGAVAVSGGTPQYGDMVPATGSDTGGCTASLIVPAYGAADYIQAGIFSSAAANTAVSTPGRYPSASITYVSGG
jgi:hypothetical protein